MTMPLRHLLFPSPIKEGEDLAGYILRRAERGAARGIGYVMRAAGLSKFDASLPMLMRSLDQLADVLREDPSRLRAAGFCSQAARRGTVFVGFANQALRRKSIGYPSARVCPKCLAEDGFARLEWQISALSECPRHALSLVSACPCGKKLSWKRASLMKCSCGRDLRNAPQVASPRYALALSEEMVRHATGTKPALFAEFLPENPANALQNFIDLCVFAGAHALKRNYKKTMWQRHDANQARELLEAAGPILLEDETKGHFAFLDSIFTEPGPGLGRLIRMFPQWYKPITVTEALAPLRGGLVRYLQARHPHHAAAMDRKSLPGMELDVQRKTISLIRAAARVGRTPKMVLKFARELGIEPLISGRGPTFDHRRFTAEDFKRLADHILCGRELIPWREEGPAGILTRRSRHNRGALLMISSEAKKLWASTVFPSRELLHKTDGRLLMSYKAVSARLHITAQHMCESHFFEKFAPEDQARYVTGVTFRSYARFEAELCAALEAAPAARPIDAVSVVRFHNRVLRPLGINMDTFLSEILAGAFGPIWHDPSQAGLHGILVREAPVCAYAESCAAARRKGWLSQKEFIARIGGTSALARHLQEKGFIRSRPNLRTGHPDIDPASVEQFSADFIGLGEIVERRLFPHRGGLRVAVRRALAALGVQPVVAPDIDGGPAVFYRRNEVENAARSASCAALKSAA